MSNAFKLIKFSLNDPMVRSFIEFPYTLYQGSSHWIAPLRLQQKDVFDPQHPFWQNASCFLALVFQKKKAVGRIAVIQSNHQVHFGFFESIDSAEVSTLLFQFAKDKTRELGFQKISGPFSPNINYELGVLVDGFNHPPKFMMPWNPEYYEKLVLQNGLTIEKTFYAYSLPVRDFVFPDKMQTVKKYLGRRYTISFRNMNFKDLGRETKIIHKIYGEAFQSHWGFEPYSIEEIRHTAKDLKFIADKDLLFFVYLNDQPAGFIIALPDLNQVLRNVSGGKLFPFGWWKLINRKRYINEVRVLNAAIRNQFRNLGIGPLLYQELHRRMKEKNYLSGELSWVVEDNVSMNNAARALGGQITKSYRIYGTSTLNL